MIAKKPKALPGVLLRIVWLVFSFVGEHDKATDLKQKRLITTCSVGE